jgi:hypothetical protein
MTTTRPAIEILYVLIRHCRWRNGTDVFPARQLTARSLQRGSQYVLASQILNWLQQGLRRPPLPVDRATSMEELAVVTALGGYCGHERRFEFENPKASGPCLEA